MSKWWRHLRAGVTVVTTLIAYTALWSTDIPIIGGYLIILGCLLATTLVQLYDLLPAPFFQWVGIGVTVPTVTRHLIESSWWISGALFGIPTLGEYVGIALAVPIAAGVWFIGLYTVMSLVARFRGEASATLYIERYTAERDEYGDQYAKQVLEDDS